ncbi:MAG: M48 family metallopeptidase [Marinifilaceae bacterium]|jgi:STE24 endopeptidase|nr:M48 family metallopeptidase [Marinifilaceae bacterium]
MSSEIILYIVLAVLIFTFVFDTFLDILNLKSWNPKLPDIVSNFYSEEKYSKSQNYHKSRFKLDMISSVWSLVVVVVMIIGGGFALLDNLLRLYITNDILLSLAFFGILMFASNLISIPFSYYSTFVIEEKYGFNKTTKKTFFLDVIKSGLVGIILGGAILSLVVYLYQFAGANFWWMVLIAISLFSVFLNMFYSTLIVPLFNKQNPLEEGELRDEINKLSLSLNFKLDNIYIIDGSKRSTKANAYFAGLGAKKRIVLFDTLINELSTKEVLAVLAHEIGHYKNKHSVYNLLLSICQTAIMLYLFSLVVNNSELAKAIGSNKPSFHLGFLVFGILYSPVSQILSLITTVFSRIFEFQADAYADKYTSAQDLGRALIKLSVSSLSNLNPHRYYVFFNYSHPTLMERLKAMDYKKEEL